MIVNFVPHLRGTYLHFICYTLYIIFVIPTLYLELFLEWNDMEGYGRVWNGMEWNDMEWYGRV